MFLKLDIRSVLICALMLMSNDAASQMLSMQNVLEAVEKNNPLLNSYGYRLKAASSLAEGAKAWMPPLIGVGPYTTPYSLQHDETFFNRNEGSVILFLEQDIPNPAKLKAKQNYLLSLSSLDSADIGSARNELFTRAKTAYIDRFMAEKRLKIIADEIDLLNLMIQTATNTYAYGKSDLASIYKAQARQHSLQAMQAHDSSAINEANSKLNYLMNLPEGTPFAIDTVIPFHEYNLSDLDTSSGFVSQHRSNITRIDRNIQSMQLNNALTLSAAKPDFNIRYEHYDMFGSRNTFSLTGAITIPIVPWSSKGYKKESLSTLQQIEAMNFEKKNDINEARSMMTQSLFRVIAEYEEVSRYANGVLPAYRKAYEAELLAYRENTGTLIFTLMAWDDLKMAQEEYLYHLEQAYKSEIEFENTIEKR